MTASKTRFFYITILFMTSIGFMISCEPLPDPCDGIDCGANGTCVAGICECDAGYDGEFCDDNDIGECSDGDYEECYTGPDGTRGVGECLDGVRSCLFDEYWGPCKWEVTPVTETCDDSLDNDCDGEIDTDCIPCIDNDEDGYGNPVVDLCDHPELDCDNDDETIHPGATEILDDAIDQDCDGRDASVNRFTDEGNGTVYDWDSGLIWLKDANAFGQRNWWDAKAAAATLDEGDFAWLTDGSSEGDWRLATKYELFPVSADGGYDLFYDVQALYWTGQDCLDIGLYTWAYLRLWGELKANAQTWPANVWPVREDN
jgi:hypothetical protein